MITIVAKSEFKKETFEEAICLLRELTDASRKEKGCIKYDLYQHKSNPQILTFLEEWVDQKAIEAHNTSEHFTRLVPQLEKLKSLPGEVDLYREFL